LGVRQNESIHPKLESRLGEYGNPESQQALEPGQKEMGKPPMATPPSVANAK
jgi:hypothetical protein